MTNGRLIHQFNKILVHDAEGVLTGTPGWREFTQPRAFIVATRQQQVLPALAQVEQAARAGAYAAGFLCYEAGSACDPALPVRLPGTQPLLAFGIYDRVSEVSLDREASACYAVSDWHAQTSASDYARAFAHIKACIARGETYQVNYTMRMHAGFTGDTWSFFLALCRAQQPRYGAYIAMGEQVICSASPELFFTRRGDTVRCRPMKGTAARGLTQADEVKQANWLQQSTKDRAENVMIVDMVRNDLGRIAETGSVCVERLFEIERYETLWQMTSTVSANSQAPLPELFRALFPSASITGAPKVRTSAIIADLESTPRGIYTGSIGFLAPGGDAQFNVAIRTAHIDLKAGRAEYGVGGGITWPSDEAGEYEECRTKALALTLPRREFDLLETLLWKPQTGYFLLNLHLRRLRDSACYFDFPFDLATAEAYLRTLSGDFSAQRQRVRFLVSPDGRIRAETSPLPSAPRRRWRLAFAQHPIDTAERLLYHKTTWREPYLAARASAPEADDVVLWNPRGEITESTIANVVIRRHGRLLTPPVSCGLLPGVYREHLLASGRIHEAIITREDILQAEALYLINSVRGWIPAEVIGG